MYRDAYYKDKMVSRNLKSCIGDSHTGIYMLWIPILVKLHLYIETVLAAL